jgi:RNA polymerase sigma-70 factor (ECF subfamily)
MAITDLDEQLLVRAHQAGDEHAFGQIVRSQHRALYAHAYRRLGNHEAAEDAVQDTLLRAYRALPSFNGDLRLRAWLHRILTNVCHDESNRRRRQTGLIEKLEAQPVLLAPDPIEEAVLHDTVRVMNEALAELPESYREALVLRYVDGLSFREVAEATGVSEENARARVHRGRVALHKVLSRVTVMLAFLIPGLRRASKTIDPSTPDAVATTGASDHAMSLSTQLASHVYQAAPMINRVAAEGSSFAAAKSSVVATAVAAVAAVAAPVAAYKVYDSTTTPDRPPAAVGAPHAQSTTSTTASSSAFPRQVPTVDQADAATTTTESTSTSTTAATLPPSAVRPFEHDGSTANEATTSTTAPPPTTAPPVEQGTVRGSIGGESFTVDGARPDFSIDGPVSLQRSDGSAVHGVLRGSVYVADQVGGDASAELELTLDDGSVHRVRFRGRLDAEDAADGATTWTMTGEYSIPDGPDLGVPQQGDTTVVFRYVDGSTSAISFELRGASTDG